MSNVNSSSPVRVTRASETTLPARFEHERPRGIADRQPTHVLGDLRLEIRQRVGAAHDDLVALGRIDERRVAGSRSWCPWLQSVLNISLSWHTANCHDR